MAKYTAKSRKQRIETLIARLESGRDVHARDLELVLTPEQLKAYKARRSEQKQIREEPLPQEIADYQKMLHRARMWEGRAEQFGGRTANGRMKNGVKRSEQQVKLNNKSDSLMEAAAEHLREALAIDPTLRIWLDRDVTQDSDGEIHIDIQDMPRVITSRSYDNALRGYGRESALGKTNIRECKTEALQAALAAMDTSQSKVADNLAAKLAALRRAR